MVTGKEMEVELEALEKRKRPRRRWKRSWSRWRRGRRRWVKRM